MTAKGLWRNELAVGGESVLIPWITTLSRPQAPPLQVIGEPFVSHLIVATSSPMPCKGARGVQAQEVRGAFACEPALHLPLGFLDGGCGRAGEAVSQKRSDKPHGHHRRNTKKKRNSFYSPFLPFCMTTVDAVAIGSQVFDAVFEKTLNFRIEMEYDSARQFIERIGQYNEFDPAWCSAR